MTETNATPEPGGDSESPAPPRYPPGRYGRRRERRARRWVPVALGLVVVVIGVAVALALTLRYGAGRPYDAEVQRFHSITETQVVVVFTVVVPEDETAVCAVRARSQDGAEVGRDEININPPPGVTRPQVEHRLVTTDRPVTGEVQRCWRARQ